MSRIKYKYNHLWIETEKAYLVSFDRMGHKEVWMPKSQAHILSERSQIICISEWFSKKISYYLYDCELYHKPIKMKVEKNQKPMEELLDKEAL